MSIRAFTLGRASYAAPVSARDCWYGLVDGSDSAVLDHAVGGVAGHAPAQIDADLAIVGGGAAAVAALVAWQRSRAGCVRTCCGLRLQKQTAVASPMPAATRSIA